MLGKAVTRLSALALATTMLATTALAQRPPSPGQGPPQLSLERAWAWLMARPGVLIAIGVILVALIYMFVTRQKKKST